MVNFYLNPISINNANNSTNYSANLLQFKSLITKNMGSTSDNNNIFNYINSDGSVNLLDLNNQTNFNNFTSNITESNIMKSFILNTTNYDDSIQPTNTTYNFFDRTKPWAIYFAEDYNSTTNTLYDCSGNKNHATTFGNITMNTSNLYGATNPISYIQGDINSGINFPNGSIPSQFTIGSITRYTDTINNKRILQGKNKNWCHGFSNINVCNYGGTQYVNYTSTNTTNWNRVIGKNDNINSINNSIIVNGAYNGNYNGGIGNDTLTINNSTITTNANSNWALSCIIIWDKILSDADMLLLDGYLNSYLTTNTFNKLQCLIQNTSLINPCYALINSNQTFLKYYFLLNVLYELYNQLVISNSNINKNDTLNLLKQGININTFINATYDTNNNLILLVSTNQISINTNNLYNNPITFVKSVSNNGNINAYNTLFNIIKPDLINHLNFIKNNDMFQAKSYASYYKLCLNILLYVGNIYLNIFNIISIPYNDTNNNYDITNIQSNINNYLNQYQIVDESKNIVKNMYDIGEINSKLKDARLNIVRKRNDYLYYKDNIINTYYTEILAITILAIVIFSCMFLLLSNDRALTIAYCILLLIIIIIIFVFVYFYLINYYFIENFNIHYAPNAIAIFNNILNNIINSSNITKISIANNLTKPALDTEKNKYNNILNQYNNYDKNSFNDLNIMLNERRKRGYNIIFLFIISVIILITTIFYAYNDNSIILIISLFFIIFILLLYYLYYNKIRYVNTERDKYYWGKVRNNNEN